MHLRYLTLALCLTLSASAQVVPSPGYVQATGVFTVGDCINVSATGTPLLIADAGQACGSGGGGTFQVNGVNLTSSSTINFQNSAATNGLTLTFANPSAGNIQLGLSGTLSTGGGGTGAASLAAANIPVQTGAITTGHCVSWASGTSIQDSGATCGGTVKTLQTFVSSAVAQATTDYLVSGSGNPLAASTNGMLMTLASGGVFKNLFISTNNTPAVGQTFIFTVYSGAAGSTGTPSSVTCTISNPNKTCNDTSDTVTVTQGQVWSIQVVTSSTSGSTGTMGLGIELDPS
jgi:hypothetical protein